MDYFIEGRLGLFRHFFAFLIDTRAKFVTVRPTVSPLSTVIISKMSLPSGGGGAAAGTSCKRTTQEDRWASSLRHISNQEMTVRRCVGYLSFFLALLAAEYFKRTEAWHLAPSSSFPRFDSLFKSMSLIALSGASVMLYSMGEMSQ